MSTYDAIIVGARCAGAATAMLLARKGRKVLVVDRDAFPSDIPHGHFIHMGGPARLHRWGLLEKLRASNCPYVLTQSVDLGDGPLVARDLVVDGVPFGCAPRRIVLDKILLDAAAAAGAHVRTGYNVEEFTSDGDRITGIRGKLRAGSTITDQARITIGADGRNSRLAQIVAAPAYEASPTATCWYFSYWSGLPADAFSLYVRSRRAVFAFPTNDGLTGIFIAFPIEEFPQIKTCIEASFQQALDLEPDLAERVRAAKREEPFRGAADLPNFFRKPFGPGWALVGDAGCHKDPFLALGISDALRDSEFLADALDAAFSGTQPMEQALLHYEQRRNQAGMPDYRTNLRMARFQPLPPVPSQLRAAVRGNQEDINRLTMANEGMLPPEQFFNPTNLGRIMAKAAGKTG